MKEYKTSGEQIAALKTEAAKLRSEVYHLTHRAESAEKKAEGYKQIEEIGRALLVAALIAGGHDEENPICIDMDTVGQVMQQPCSIKAKGTENERQKLMYYKRSDK